MERPSHMNFRHQSVSQRLPLVGLSLTLPAGMFWLFANGLTASLIHTVLPPDLTFTPFKQEAVKQPPPTEPKLAKRIETPVMQPPIFNVGREPGPNTITMTTQQTHPAMPPAVSDRAPVSIAATHTTPPYPVIARRVGWEGTVMLRLTVSPQGRVIHAEVMNSSGRAELDQTAQAWVVSHWTYRPAIRDGSPVEAHVLTRVLFSLDGQR